MRRGWDRCRTAGLVATGIVAIALGRAAPGAQVDAVVVDDCLIVSMKERDIIISARIEGEIKTMFFKQGDPVKEGQVIAQLVDDEAKHEVEIRRMDAESDVKILAAEAMVKVRDFDYKAKTELYTKRKAVSEFEWRMAEANLEVAKLQVEQSKVDQQRAKVLYRLSQRRLEDYKVKAPISGVLHQMVKSAGEGVKPREPMFRLLDTRVVLVEGYLDVAYLDQVQEGQSVTVCVTLYEKQTFPGKVVFKDIQVESASDKFRVRAEVANPDGRIRPGLRAMMRIRLPRAPAKEKKQKP